MIHDANKHYSASDDLCCWHITNYANNDRWCLWCSAFLVKTTCISYRGPYILLKIIWLGQLCRVDHRYMTHRHYIAMSTIIHNPGNNTWWQQWHVVSTITHDVNNPWYHHPQCQQWFTMRTTHDINNNPQHQPSIITFNVNNNPRCQQ